MPFRRDHPNKKAVEASALQKTWRMNVQRRSTLSLMHKRALGHQRDFGSSLTEARRAMRFSPASATCASFNVYQGKSTSSQYAGIVAACCPQDFMLLHSCQKATPTQTFRCAACDRPLRIVMIAENQFKLCDNLGFREVRLLFESPTDAGALSTLAPHWCSLTFPQIVKLSF